MNLTFTVSTSDSQAERIRIFQLLDLIYDDSISNADLPSTGFKIPPPPIATGAMLDQISHIHAAQQQQPLDMIPPFHFGEQSPNVAPAVQFNAPAPVQQATITQSISNGGHQQVDKSGTPWCDEIHSTPATMNPSGQWRSRRGVDKLKAAIKSEELRRVFAMNPNAAPPAAPAIQTPPPPPMATVQTPPPPMATVQTPPPPVLAEQSAFAKLMLQLTPNMQPAGPLTDQHIQSVAQSIGLRSIVDLQNNEAMIPNFINALNASFA